MKRVPEHGDWMIAASHPAWVHGLKQTLGRVFEGDGGRTPRGCVD